MPLGGSAPVSMSVSDPHQNQGLQMGGEEFGANTSLCRRFEGGLIVVRGERLE